MMRRAVWQRCAARFARGSRVLEMNCGTGEDALWLASRGVRVLATDIAPRMLQAARDKLAGSAAAANAEFRQLAWEDLARLDSEPFDGLLSNFGGLNCVADLGAAARASASKLRRGASALLCIMGPCVPWEWAWFLAHGKPQAAFRRLRRGGVRWSGMTVRYPSVAATRRAFAPEFRVTRVSGLGALLPPPYTDKMFANRVKFLATLERAERRLEAVWPLPWLADHYLMELERL